MLIRSKVKFCRRRMKIQYHNSRAYILKNRLEWQYRIFIVLSQNFLMNLWQKNAYQNFQKKKIILRQKYRSRPTHADNTSRITKCNPCRHIEHNFIVDAACSGSRWARSTLEPQLALSPPSWFYAPRVSTPFARARANEIRARARGIPPRTAAASDAVVAPSGRCAVDRASLWISSGGVRRMMACLFGEESDGTRSFHA